MPSSLHRIPPLPLLDHPPEEHPGAEPSQRQSDIRSFFDRARPACPRVPPAEAVALPPRKRRVTDPAGSDMNMHMRCAVAHGSESHVVRIGPPKRPRRSAQPVCPPHLVHVPESPGAEMASPSPLFTCTRAPSPHEQGQGRATQDFGGDQEEDDDDHDEWLMPQPAFSVSASRAPPDAPAGPAAPGSWPDSLSEPTHSLGPAGKGNSLYYYEDHPSMLRTQHLVWGDETPYLHDTLSDPAGMVGSEPGQLSGSTHPVNGMHRRPDPVRMNEIRRLNGLDITSSQQQEEFDWVKQHAPAPLGPRGSALHAIPNPRARNRAETSKSSAAVDQNASFNERIAQVLPSSRPAQPSQPLPQSSPSDSHSLPTDLIPPASPRPRNASPPRPGFIDMVDDEETVPEPSVLFNLCPPPLPPPFPMPFPMRTLNPTITDARHPIHPNVIPSSRRTDKVSLSLKPEERGTDDLNKEQPVNRLPLSPFASQPARTPSKAKSTTSGLSPLGRKLLGSRRKFRITGLIPDLELTAKDGRPCSDHSEKAEGLMLGDSPKNMPRTSRGKVDKHIVRASPRRENKPHVSANSEARSPSVLVSKLGKQETCPSYISPSTAGEDEFVQTTQPVQDEVNLLFSRSPSVSSHRSEICPASVDSSSAATEVLPPCTPTPPGSTRVELPSECTTPLAGKMRKVIANGAPNTEASPTATGSTSRPGLLSGPRRQQHGIRSPPLNPNELLTVSRSPSPAMEEPSSDRTKPDDNSNSPDCAPATQTGPTSDQEPSTRPFITRQEAAETQVLPWSQTEPSPQIGKSTVNEKGMPPSASIHARSTFPSQKCKLSPSAQALTLDLAPLAHAAKDVDYCWDKMPVRFGPRDTSTHSTQQSLSRFFRNEKTSSDKKQKARSKEPAVYLDVEEVDEDEMFAQADAEDHDKPQSLCILTAQRSTLWNTQARTRKDITTSHSHESPFQPHLKTSPAALQHSTLDRLSATDAVSGHADGIPRPKQFQSLKAAVRQRGNCSSSSLRPCARTPNDLSSHATGSFRSKFTSPSHPFSQSHVLSQVPRIPNSHHTEPKVCAPPHNASLSRKTEPNAPSRDPNVKKAGQDKIMTFTPFASRNGLEGEEGHGVPSGASSRPQQSSGMCEPGQSGAVLYGADPSLENSNGSSWDPSIPPLSLGDWTLSQLKANLSHLSRKQLFPSSSSDLAARDESSSSEAG